MPPNVPPINEQAEPQFGAAGAALMAAMVKHRRKQSAAAGYQHPPSHPPAHPVGRPGEPGGLLMAAAGQRGGMAY